MRKNDFNYFTILKIDGVLQYHRFKRLTDAVKLASEKASFFVSIEDKNGDVVYESIKTCTIGNFRYTEFRELKFERLDAKC